jgi:hypothetical protein
MAARKTPAQATTPSTARSLSPKPPPVPPSSEPPVPSGPRPIKVRATAMCYYDHARRREGDVFFIAQRQDFNERCMEYCDPSTPERVTGAGAALAQQHDEILAGRTPLSSANDEPHI